MKERIKDNSLLTTLLLVAFIVLKLCNVITWSWWWVISPFWIPIVVAIPFVIIMIWQRKKKIKKDGPPKSRWQERMEEMQRRQKQSAKN